MQIQAGTVRLSGISDQPVDPLAATPKTCATIDVASPHVGEWKKIIEKLISAKVRIMPASADRRMARRPMPASRLRVCGA